MDIFYPYRRPGRSVVSMQPSSKTKTMTPFFPIIFISVASHVNFLTSLSAHWQTIPTGFAVVRLMIAFSAVVTRTVW